MGPQSQLPFDNLGAHSTDPHPQMLAPTSPIQTSAKLAALSSFLGPSIEKARWEKMFIGLQPYGELS